MSKEGEKSRSAVLVSWGAQSCAGGLQLGVPRCCRVGAATRSLLPSLLIP